MWTGPLAWAPIGFAFVAAVGSGPLISIGRAIGAGDCRRSMALSGVATLAVGVIVAWTVAPRVPGGDEPHYLVIAQSLIKDGDLRIENNHRDPDYVAMFGVLKPDRLRNGRNGEIYSIHAPGLAVLVLPAYAMFGYRGAQAMVLLLAAMTGSLIWRLGWRTTRDTRAAWFAWAAVVGSTSFLLQSVTVFPDGPGALVVAAGLLLLLKLRDEPARVGLRALVVVSALVGALPWLHTRFAVLAGVVGLLVLWRLVTDESRPLGARRARVATFLALPLVSAAGWFTFFEVIYGTPNPTAPYGADPGTRLAYVPGGLVALLFDEQFGLITYAPVLCVAAIGFWRAADRQLGRTRLESLAIVVPYLVAVTTYWMWWAGRPAPPARFAAAILPALAPGLAIAWHRAGAGVRRGLLALLALSIAITVVVVGIDRGGLAWNDRDAEARWLDWLGPVVNLPRGWPSFFWKLNPDKLTSELPFALHVGLWLAIFLAAWIVVQAIGRRRSWTGGTWRLGLALGLLAGVMTATQVGWWLNGVNGLDPARSQIALLSRGASAWSVAALGIRRVARPLDVGLTIRSEEPGRTDAPAPWLTLSSVPPGQYALHVTTSRPRPGQLLVTVGEASRPLRTFDVQPVNRQTFEMSLPAGALGLTVAQDAALSAIGGRVDLEPTHLLGAAPLARSSMAYESADVFFVDDNVFVESAGFWVRGEQTANVVVAPPAIRGGRGTPGAGFQMVLRNGAAQNVVTVDTGNHPPSTLRLAPSEERAVDLSQGVSSDAVRVQIRSASGFRPSDASQSADTRYLGVWVALR